MHVDDTLAVVSELKKEPDYSLYAQLVRSSAQNNIGNSAGVPLTERLKLNYACVATDVY